MPPPAALEIFQENAVAFITGHHLSHLGHSIHFPSCFQKNGACDRTVTIPDRA